MIFYNPIYNPSLRIISTQLLYYKISIGLFLGYGQKKSRVTYLKPLILLTFQLFSCDDLLLVVLDTLLMHRCISLQISLKPSGQKFQFYIFLYNSLYNPVQLGYFLGYNPQLGYFMPNSITPV